MNRSSHKVMQIFRLIFTSFDDFNDLPMKYKTKALILNACGGYKQDRSAERNVFVIVASLLVHNKLSTT